MSKVVLDIECYGFEDSSLLQKPLDQHVRYEGSGENRLLVVFKDPVKFIQPEHREMLEKMLKATGNELEDAKLVNLYHSKLRAFAILNRLFLVNSIILFGITPQEIKLNLEIEKNKVNQFNDQKILLTDSLNDLQQTPSLKGPLWQALQQMFSLEK